ncbi:MAG: DUF177 domain-containing protein [Deltaproteobacteria bacterium]|nr:DUF177 domain-containing protein [Deltaproteobacteria bacterium]
MEKIFFGAELVKIDFYEIPDSGLFLSVDDAQWLPPDLERAGRAEASLLLKKRGQRIAVTGKLAVAFVFVCDRCLEKFTLPLDSDFSIELELPGDAVSEQEKDHFCHDAEMDIDILHDTEINIADLLQQQLYLALPMKKICNEKCRGICANCGANLNNDKCRCAPDRSNPFSVLTKLKI